MIVTLQGHDNKLYNQDVKDRTDIAPLNMEVAMELGIVTQDAYNKMLAQLKSNDDKVQTYSTESASLIYGDRAMITNKRVAGEGACFSQTELNIEQEPYMTCFGIDVYERGDELVSETEYAQTV